MCYVPRKVCSTSPRFDCGLSVVSRYSRTSQCAHRGKWRKHEAFGLFLHFLHVPPGSQDPPSLNHKKPGMVRQRPYRLQPALLPHNYPVLRNYPDLFNDSGTADAPLKGFPATQPQTPSVKSSVLTPTWHGTARRYCQITRAASVLFDTHRRVVSGGHDGEMCRVSLGR